MKYLTELLCRTKSIQDTEIAEEELMVNEIELDTATVILEETSEFVRSL